MKFSCCCLSSGLLGVNISASESQQVSGELGFIVPSEKKFDASLQQSAQDNKIIKFTSKFQQSLPAQIESKNEVQNFRSWDIGPTYLAKDDSQNFPVNAEPSSSPSANSGVVSANQVRYFNI
jgi:hypothetical protein